MNETTSPSSQSPQPPSRLRRVARVLLRTLVVLVAVTGLWAVTVEVALWRGSACLESRDHERALSWLRLAERISFERAELHFLLARTCRRLEQFEEVETHLRGAFEMGWEVSQLEREQWLALAQTGQFDEVNPHWATLFEDPGADGPEISKAYVTASLAWFRIGDANRVLDAWTKDFPNDPEPHFQRGHIAETMLSWSDAVKHFRRTVELDPERGDARLGLGAALVKQGKIEEAEEHLRLACERQPDDVKARIAYAQCLSKLDRIDEARSMLAKVLESTPDHVQALLELGMIELAAGANEQSLQHLQRAAKLKPENREIIYAYANALKKNGKSEEAVKHLKFVDEATKPMLRLKNLTNQLLANPQDTDLRFQVALITWRYKSREEGEHWLRSLLKIDPRHQPTHAALAEHYALVGDDGRAAHHRRMAGITDPAKTEQQQDGQ